MSAEARYFRVGLFVFSGIALTVAAALVLGGQRWFEQPVLVETYFDESVTGLEVGSPVRLRGVKLGVVSDITFVQDHYRLEDPEQQRKFGQLVRVVMDVTPQRQLGEEDRRLQVRSLIDQGLRMQITPQAITGVSYVQADFLDPKRNPPLEIPWEPDHLHVSSAPSTISAISSAAERIFRRLEDVRVEQVVQNLDKLLVTLTTGFEGLDLAGLESEVEQLIQGLQQTNRRLQSDLRKADVPALGASARNALEELDTTLARTRRMIDGGKYDFEVALENIRVASENLRDLTESLRAQPSLLIRGSAPERTEATP